MGQRGPAPKPKTLKDLEGNPGKRTKNDSAPEASGAPRCPAHLDEYGKAVWKRIRESMPDRLYGRADTELLAAYCQAAHMHRKAVQKIRTEGEVCEAESGALYQSPWVGILNKQAALMATLGTRLGLDPSARSGLQLPEEKPKSKFEGLVGIKGGKTG